MTFGLCVAYYVIFKIFTVFFSAEKARISIASIRSVVIILVISVLGYIITFKITDLELGNRVLHIVVGGFLVTLICFLVVKDGGFQINKLQFFIFSLFVVTAFGVFNEHIEYFLQTYVRVLFYSNPRDTWLDLLSNSIGIISANIILLPFINRKV